MSVSEGITEAEVGARGVVAADIGLQAHGENSLAADGQPGRKWRNMAASLGIAPQLAQSCGEKITRERLALARLPGKRFESLPG